MCHLFLQVAKLYIQAKKNDPRSQQQHQQNQRNQQRQQYQQQQQTVSAAASDNLYTTTDDTQLNPSTMTQFDPYLSALGIVPTSTWSMTGYTPTAMESFSNTQNVHVADPFGVGYAPSGGPQNSVQDWFSGSRYLMNLMEAGDDMQMPDLNDFDVNL